ncbi:alpha/beta hydrolase [Brumimicrobium glaciale]|uniref:Alpha/beta hydrolase n=1 Tax=Brumimicrobium glaciale TaxID=200475 RepID=A0A4Q4KNF3_9FLAO|nr:alpha/beta hydrolase-fold protein [Brumimicrobium glaciale]RYM34678.1 alpha/beta hydrolase [Brumimicrobium glaciale]
MKYLFLYTALLFLTSCGTKVQYNDPVPNHDTFTMHSPQIGEDRVINVWLPPQYDSSTDSFPVLYMADGGIVMEDFPHIANTLAKLIELDSIPPIILVGIENTDRRRDLTGFSDVEKDSNYCPLTDGAKNFRAFITNELFTKIESKYRVNNQKGLIGESLSGLFVMETFFLQPEAFDFYIAMDPSLWWNDGYLVKNTGKLMTNFPDEEKKLWFAGSVVPDISINTNQLEKKLEKFAPQNLKWTYSDEPEEKHHTIFRATKEKALIWSLGNS